MFCRAAASQHLAIVMSNGLSTQVAKSGAPCDAANSDWLDTLAFRPSCYVATSCPGCGTILWLAHRNSQNQKPAFLRSGAVHQLELLNLDWRIISLVLNNSARRRV